MTKKAALILGVVVMGAVVGTAAVLYYRYFRGASVAWRQPSENILELLNPADNKATHSATSSEGSTSTASIPPVAITIISGPLQLPSGFSISIFAEKVPGARVMVIDNMGNMWVSQTRQGAVSLLEVSNGTVVHTSTPFRNLKNPHGLAFDPDDPFVLYIAEEHRISKVRVYSEDSLQKVADLPSGGRHVTRTLGFGPDKRLYVSIGSSCDTCYEEDKRRAAIYSLNKDGSDFKEHATGLRNAVFFTWRNGNMWTTEMGRDYLGDNLPPDEINIVRQGNDYGWPICYGKNIHDAKFDTRKYIQDPCQDKTPSFYDLPAHVAPLGLAFIPDAGWPKDYQGDLLVAYHGSWNSTVPVGYKVVRLQMSWEEGPRVVGVEDFVTGWLVARKGVPSLQALGRPVGILVQDQTIYISDDKAGVIYKIQYK